MIYMGADLSTTSTGIGILEDDKLIYYECIKPKSKNWEERVRQISLRLNEILNEYKIENIYVEDIPLKDGKLTIKKLAIVRGALTAISSLHNIPLIADSVSDWRKNAGFYDGTKEGMKREAMKQKAINKVKELFKIEVNDDIAEAILIAYYHKYPNKEKRGFNKK